MKSFKKIFQVQFFVALLAVLFLASCSSENNNKMTSSMNVAEANKTRNARAVAAEYQYKSLATFKKGQSSFTLDQMAALAGKQISIVLIYEIEAPWAAAFKEGKLDKTGDDTFNARLEEYSLKIAKQFPIDEAMDALVLEGKEGLDPKAAVDAARDLSMIDHVAMVEVKEIPAQQPTTETAKN